MPKLRKVTDDLSEEGQRLMRRGFAEGRSAALIVEAIARATREVVAERTVARRRIEWQAEIDRRKRARERMEDLVASLKDSGMATSDTIMALARERLEENPEALAGGDPMELHSMSLKAEEVALKRRQLDIRDREVALDERKAEMLEAREARAREAVGELVEKKITPEQMADKIREVYGLNR
jgi:hypothetical protein